MVRQLHPAGQGARAKLQANYGRLGCTTSVPMLLRLFFAVDAPGSLYGLEVWGSQLQGRLASDAKKCVQLCAVCLLAQCLWSLACWHSYACQFERGASGALHSELVGAACAFCSTDVWHAIWVVAP